MSHLSRDTAKLVGRLRRIKGQIEGVERALEADADCTEVLRQIASIRGAMLGLTGAVMEDHLRNHVVAASSDTERAQAAEEMIQILKSYMK
jgi:DNA-binding FrmR family transcriptional regulator